MVSASEGSSFAELLANGGSFNLPWELLRSLWGGSPYTLPSLGLTLLELVPRLLPADRDRYVRLGLALRAELAERLGPGGVMLYPSYASPAPRHGKPLLPPWYWVYTSIVNVLELPSTQVPLGLNDAGLPLGLQVVGPRDHDHVTIAVALALEKAFGGWVPPPA
jgi:fatty acid amide hydrolase 2